jgi:hypothetical protein
MKENDLKEIFLDKPMLGNIMVYIDYKPKYCLWQLKINDENVFTGADQMYPDETY